MITVKFGIIKFVDWLKRLVIYYRVGREIPVVGIPSGNYREITSWEIL